MNPQFHCFGDRRVFAIEARLLPDPDPAGAAREDVWSYGEFRVFVKDRCLTRHSVPSGVREEIRWYLAPLLRWLHSAWLPLFHEQRLPSLVGNHENLVLRFEQGERLLLDDESSGASGRRGEMQAWRRRHAFWSAASGGIFPNIWFRRQSDLCEVAYDPGVTIGAPRGFEFQFTRGAVLIDVDIVAQAFSAFMHWGAEAGAGVALPDESATAAQSAERWLIGEHLAAVLVRANVAAQPLIHGVIAMSSPEVAMFGTLRPDLSDEDAQVLLRQLDRARSEMPERPELQSLVMELGAPTRDTAWEQGYDLALRTHDELDSMKSSTTFIDIERILAGLGVSVDGVRVGDVSLRGVAIAGHGFSPTVIVNESARWNSSEPGRRFTLAHEFGHILGDRGRARRVTHSSTPWAPEAVERRANAFAAMFLMPYRAIDLAIDQIGPVMDGRGLTRLARRLRCGRLAVLEHLKNLDRISSDAYYRIRTEFAQV